MQVPDVLLLLVRCVMEMLILVKEDEPTVAKNPTIPKHYTRKHNVIQGICVVTPYVNMEPSAMTHSRYSRDHEPQEPETQLHPHVLLWNHGIPTVMSQKACTVRGARESTQHSQTCTVHGKRRVIRKSTASGCCN